MAITQAMCNSFKLETMDAIHDLNTDVLKIALYVSAATLDASTTVYSATNEVVGTGYTAGGNTLTGAAISLSGSTAIADFNDSTWATSTITARGAMIYNSSKANRAIAILDFGSDRTSTASDFTVVFPAAAAATAIIRLA